jgi:hypothetical protein
MRRLKVRNSLPNVASRCPPVSQWLLYSRLCTFTHQLTFRTTLFGRCNYLLEQTVQSCRQRPIRAPIDLRR